MFFDISRLDDPAALEQEKTRRPVISRVVVRKQRPTPLARVEAKIAEARQAGVLVPRRRHVKAKDDKTSWHPLRRNHAEVALRRRRIEEDAVTALHLRTRDAERALRARSRDAARALVRWCRNELDATWRAWLATVAIVSRAVATRALFERGRARAEKRSVLEATSVVARFVRAAARRQALRKAADCVVHAAVAIRAQGAFRTACARLYRSIVLIQRRYRTRAAIVEAECDLVARQWRRKNKSEQGRAAAAAAAAARDLVRKRRQAHVLRLIVYERYELRPALVEAIKATLPGSSSRADVRRKVDRAQRCGFVGALARAYAVDYDPPRYRRFCFDME